MPWSLVRSTEIAPTARAAEYVLLAIAALTACQFMVALLDVDEWTVGVVVAFAIVVLFAAGLPVIFSRLVARGSRLSIPIAVVTLAWAVAGLFYGVDLLRLIQLELAVALLVITFLPGFRGYVTSRRTAEPPVRLHVERGLD